MEVKRFETIHGGIYAWDGDHLSRQLEEFSAHTRNEMAMVQSFIREGDNLIDVGGHVGTTAIPFARFNGGRGKVFTFEPNPGNFELLRRNIAENGLEGTIVAVRAIVSEMPGRFRMSQPQPQNSGTFCFLPEADGAPGPGDEPGPPSLNLDDWLRREQGDPTIHLIKIDTEGAEMSVLRACRRTIERDRPILYVEIGQEALARFRTTPEDVAGFLQGLGYDLFRNVGERNSANDDFVLMKMSGIEEGGDFFDVLAVHRSSPRYPRRYTGRRTGLKRVARRLFRRVLGR